MHTNISDAKTSLSQLIQKDNDESIIIGKAGNPLYN
jgi:hypothetical protein